MKWRWQALVALTIFVAGAVTSFAFGAPEALWGGLLGAAVTQATGPARKAGGS